MAKPSVPPQQKPLDLFGFLHDFFGSQAWLVIRNVGVFVLAVAWLGSVLWTWKDARRRIADPVLVACAVALGAVPILGTAIYLLLRPPEYLDDVRERRLEIEALEEALAAANALCPTCAAPVQDDFLVCPVCVTRLRDACAGCGAPLEALWQACPRCATPRDAKVPSAELDEYLLEVARDVPAEDAAEAPAGETV